MGVERAAQTRVNVRTEQRSYRYPRRTDPLEQTRQGSECRRFENDSKHRSPPDPPKRAFEACSSGHQQLLYSVAFRSGGRSRLERHMTVHENLSLPDGQSLLTRQLARMVQFRLEDALPHIQCLFLGERFYSGCTEIPFPCGVAFLLQIGQHSVKVLLRVRGRHVRWCRRYRVT